MPRIATVSLNRQRWIPTALTSGLVIVCVTAFGFMIRDWAAWTDGEMSVLQFVSERHNGFFNALALGIDWLCGPIGAVVLTLAIAAALALGTRGVRAPLVFAALTFIPWLSSAIVKTLVARPRPDSSLLANPFVGDPGKHSFPSGHTAFATALLVAIAFTLAPGRARTTALWLGSALAVLTACSRVYLGVHYPSDVIASMILMPAVAVLACILVVRFIPALTRWAGLAVRADTAP